MPEVTAKQDAADQRRHELIIESARLALQIEDAENRGNAVAEARRRMTYHTGQAELTGLTKGGSLAAQENHLVLARTYQRELYRLGGEE
ncbi:hypothetical protein SAMN05216571_101381 [Onishia taeanensis]|uniref:Uncharacterized protein n=1 Tax=Onishia taeanensis TaxID=284577 RepID=A0A1G7NDW6_9GAMM|nr:hypothetical protein [Halomonas taeanensis]SDF72146.1 hypothetical protein SAMN05216571_101381 [Halomonas taeanensis]